MTDKPDLRDRNPNGQRHATPSNTDVKFAGDENRNVMPSSGKLVTPDPGNVPEGQTTKG